MSSASLKGGPSRDQGQEALVGSGAAAEEQVKGPSQAELWQKIKAFELDRTGDRFPFSARLARENGWSRSFALRVVEEYRRFVYLMATAPHPVSPSEAVDQAWHLHMTYTRSYWAGLCRGVVGREMHHDPTRGGNDETAKFTDWYARTLDGYRRTFGQPAPGDIWPPADRRFTPSRMQWVDLEMHRLVPRQARRGGWTSLAWMIGGVGAIGVVGCSAGGAPSDSGRMLLGAVCFVMAFMGVMALVVIANLKRLNSPPRTLFSKRGTRRSDDGSSWSAGGLFMTGDNDSPVPPHGHGGHHHGHGHSGDQTSPPDSGHGHGHGDSGYGASDSGGGHGGSHGCASGGSDSGGGSSGCSSGSSGCSGGSSGCGGGSSGCSSGS